MMLQSFTDDTNPTDSVIRLKKLRAQMKKNGVNAYLVPRADAFMGEYVPPCSMRLKWLTGFDGSAGIAIITQKKAALFVDGRYILQAPKQVNTDCFDIVSSMETPLHSWLTHNVSHHSSTGYQLGFDPMLHTYMQINTLQTKLAKNIKLKPLAHNLVDAIWDDIPLASKESVYTHPNRLAGRNSLKKRQDIAQKIKTAKAHAFLITQPESIAWLLNIRGRDVPHTPFALSYGILYADGKFDWIIDEDRVTANVKKHIGNGLKCIAPTKMPTLLKKLRQKRVLLHPASANYGFTLHLPNYIDSPELCALPKACKTNAEINGAVTAHIRDGVALCAFLHWFDKEAPKGTQTEISAAQKLEKFRQDTNKLQDLSFDTISGSGSNGAIIHYRVTEKTNRAIKPGDVYLVDSGGQYQDGTTDVTRTLLVGGSKVTKDAITAFTYVLKGHIALARAKFPAGTNGIALDALARAPLWEAGLDFDHGTGHGVGAYLSVHEGPQSISKSGTQPLCAGMIISNEPGYYRASAFGIRIENLQYVTKAKQTHIGERPMHGFEILTLAPIDKNLIDKNLLTHIEIDWLNLYHQKVFDTIAPLLHRPAASWLKQATKKLEPNNIL